MFPARSSLIRACLPLGSLLISAGVARAQTAELAKLLAAASRVGDTVGWSVALDGGRALLGAPHTDDNGGFSGAAYVFEMQPDGTWVVVSRLLASDGEPGDFFGAAVAISADLALVGAPFEEDFTTLTGGSVYVFERQPGGTWVETAKLIASDSEFGEDFGAALALSGERALVGSRVDDDLGQASGSAYVFERQPGGTWVETIELHASDGGIYQGFGSSVAVLGDRALLGAPGDATLAQAAGAAYVFELQGGAWVETAKLLESVGAKDGQFGRSSALTDERLLVSAAGENLSGPNGRAYVFELQPSGWVETAKLEASDAQQGDLYGLQVSLSGERALISSLYGGPNSSGAAYVYEVQPDGSWAETRLLASDGEPIDLFSHDVAIWGDRVLVGAPFDNDLGFDAGSAYVFDLLPLESSVTQISLSNGGVQPLELDAGHLHANETYLLLGSMSGTSPGIPLAHGLLLPLNADRYFTHTLERPNRPPLAGSKGKLNDAGHAEATFSTVPLDLNLVGVMLHHAFVTLGSAQALSTGTGSGVPGPALATFASNAFPLVFVP